MIIVGSRMLKQLFKKVQKIPISIVIIHFWFFYIIRPIYTFFYFLNTKLNSI